MSSKEKHNRPKPNPLFEKWISEWLVEATEKNLEVRHGYRKALNSLKKYPLPLKSGKECMILQFFGKKLCDKLDRRLEHHKCSNIVEDNVIEIPQQTIQSQYLKSKSTIAKSKNQKSSMHLISSPSKENCNNIEPDTAVLEKIIIKPNEFTIILLIDTGETSSIRKTDITKVTAQLSLLNVSFEMRRLSIGDFAWICRDCHGNELMLPYIVERKRLDDLSSSIQDGRFHEQKFRLKQCGIENKIYLIEMGKKYHGLPLANLYQGIANTEVIDGFTVLRSENHLESINYIATLTGLLADMYKNKILTTIIDNEELDNGSMTNAIKLISFKHFNKGSSKSKNMTVRDMFIRHLLQLRGLSVKKAFAIVEHYPTPISLMKAFKDSGNPFLLANITYDVPSKMIGQIISKTLFQLYSNNQNTIV
ncbi:crossover junction endonuclease MUS81 isoform X2 [Daktulosphaira vitifoliae]|uniref:crossover junction endonuclease MUS81 isoform X2 n=1 Tax=Daktulosphaira vitifoliae TaxID=58002 RepID=UPI0021AA6C4B|nr:crossover junction endonuclease MUS81 isoform X2 [Daktulosphaira vitifoliae]